MSESLVKVKNVSLSYQGRGGIVSALENIEMDIDEGDFLCLLGPSGCGKSTLLRIIAGIMQPSNGCVMLNNKEITGISADIGVIFQKDTLFEWYSVRDNISFGLRMRHKMKENDINKATDSILGIMNLSEFADKMVYELSGGMRQRVSIARTLITTPKIILMDEPFSALDALTREHLQDFLRDLWIRDKTTILFITHDIDEAMVLGNRVMIMSNRPGKIKEDIHINYTYSIAEEGNSRQRLGADYFRLRRRIYDLIDS